MAASAVAMVGAGVLDGLVADSVWLDTESRWAINDDGWGVAAGGSMATTRPLDSVIASASAVSGSLTAMSTVGTATANTGVACVAANVVSAG